MSSVHTHDGRDPWHALYTRSRHEKKVAAALERRGFGVYLPLVPRESHWHDRRKTIEWPLFPGYVFVRFSREDSAAVLGTPGVATLVRVDDRPATVSEEEIENVRLLVTAIKRTGQIPKPETLLHRGQSVIVRDGPFRGLKGFVLEQRGNRVTIQVGVAAIQQGIRVEVPKASIGLTPSTRGRV